MWVVIAVEILLLTILAKGIYLFKKSKKIRFLRSSLKRSDFNKVFVRKKFSELKLIKNMRIEKKDKEIYEAISYLRNITAIGVGKTMNTDAILEELIELRGRLKPVYTKMLGLLRVNQPEAAASAFYENIGSEISRDFGRLLIRWDEINPEELTETLISHQTIIKEIRATNQKKRDEVISDLIYFPVVVNVIVILINFIYVGYFIEQQELFKTLF